MVVDQVVVVVVQGTVPNAVTSGGGLDTEFGLCRRAGPRAQVFWVSLPHPLLELGASGSL